MKLLYVTDTKLFYNENGFFKSEYLEPDELGDVCEDISEVVFWGRLYYVEDAKGLLPLKSDKYTFSVVGNKNQSGGLLGYASGLFKMIKGLKKEVESSDIIWLKFSFFSSYIAGFCLKKRQKSRKIVISQLVGDFDCISLINPGKFFKLINSVSKALYRKIIKKCDLQVYVSEMLEKKYKVFGIKSKVINENRVKIRDIVDSKSISRHNKEEPLRLIFVGRLSPEKRIFDIIKAVEGIRGVTLSILGEGNQKGQIIDYINTHNLGDKISMCGTRKWGEEMFAFMKKHHALVLPSESEGLPLVILEAMSCGISVMASCVGGIPEIVKNENNGQLFAVGNITELKKCIEKIRDYENFRTGLIINGLATARENCFENQLKSLSDEITEIRKVKHFVT
ncbi:MAG: glycosyltransferase family 4 protein [Firmicutes bacterium]|nr:glycosyltransferase family 4 protein [Bacillota bacterium]